MAMLRRRLSAALVGVLAALVAALAAGAPARAAVPDLWAYSYVDNPVTPPGVPTVTDPSRQDSSLHFACGLATVTAFPTGIYQVRYPCLAIAGGIAHVTTVDKSGGYCTAGSWGPIGGSEAVTVFCFDSTGAPAPRRFAVMFTRSSGAPPGPGHAYVFADFNGVVLDSYNSAGPAVSVSHAGVGVYVVKLPGQVTGAHAGDVQVSAVHPNQTPRRCKVGQWVPSGPDYIVVVLCFNQVNVRTDTWFTVSFHEKRTVFGARPPAVIPVFGYLWFHHAAATPPGTTFNSLGMLNTAVPVAPRIYQVSFPGLGSQLSHLQVSTYGTDPDYCQLYDVWTVAPPNVTALVRCFGVASGANDSFLASFASTA